VSVPSRESYRTSNKRRRRWERHQGDLLPSTLTLAAPRTTIPMPHVLRSARPRALPDWERMGREEVVMVAAWCALVVGRGRGRERETGGSEKENIFLCNQ
jgi:hypothetical protein